MLSYEEAQLDNPIRIIVNCDDLGMSPAVNQAIFSLMERGRVSSATLMMNAPAIEQAAAELGRFPACSFGVHLNLTQFAPLSNAPGLAPLLGPDGQFNGVDRPSPLAIPLSASIRAAIFAEWSAQIDRALALGLPISHIDSHHHVHTRFGLAPELARLIARYRLGRVRLRFNLLTPERRHRLRPRLGLLRNGLWNIWLRHRPGVVTADRFCHFATFHALLLAGELERAGCFELMCHPGSPRYAAEEHLLRGDSWLARLGPAARLISYNELEQA